MPLHIYDIGNYYETLLRDVTVQYGFADHCVE